MIYLYFASNKSLKDLGINWESKDIDITTISNAIPHPNSELTLSRLEGDSFRYFNLPENSLREDHVIQFSEFIVNQQQRYELEHFHIATYSAIVLAVFLEKVMKKEIKPSDLVLVAKQQEYYLDDSGELYTNKGNLNTFKDNCFPISMRLALVLYNFDTDMSIEIEE